MKELIGKIELKLSNLPRRITDNKFDIFDERNLQMNLTLPLQT